MGLATEELAARSGPGIGGLLNVTFGNAAELIIALFAPRGGPPGGREGLDRRLDPRQPSAGPRRCRCSSAGSGARSSLQRAPRPTRSRRCSSWRSRRSMMPAIFALVEGGGLPPVDAEIVELRVRPRGALDRRGDRPRGSPTSPGWSSRCGPTGPLQPAPTPRRQHGQPSAGRSGGRSRCCRSPAPRSGSMSEILVGSISEASEAIGISEFFIGIIIVADRRQRGRALGRGARRQEEQDGPGGQHLDRLGGADRAVRRADPGPLSRSSSAPARCRSSSTASSSARSSSRS